MYIGTFTAHQQRNMVQTPHFFWAGDASVDSSGIFSELWIILLMVYGHLNYVQSQVLCFGLITFWDSWRLCIFLPTSP